MTLYRKLCISLHIYSVTCPPIWAYKGDLCYIFMTVMKGTGRKEPHVTHKYDTNFDERLKHF
jgi:hypothetical protein